jgi:hypothetical protein
LLTYTSIFVVFLYFVPPFCLSSCIHTATNLKTIWGKSLPPVTESVGCGLILCDKSETLAHCNPPLQNPFHRLVQSPDFGQLARPIDNTCSLFCGQARLAKPAATLATQMVSRKNERKVQPSTDDHAPSAAHRLKPLNGEEGVATSGLAAHPLGPTNTSSPKEGEQIRARISAQDAARTTSKDGDASKPPKQMLSDWKQHLRRSASSAGSLKPVLKCACLTEFVRHDKTVRRACSNILSVTGEGGSLALSNITMNLKCVVCEYEYESSV